MATDISEAALVVARRNARRHGVADRIRFVHANMLDTLDDFDLIVANPPYVRQGDRRALQPEVRDYEPGVALFGGDSGFDLVVSVVEQAAARLRPGGFLIFEFGFGQDDRRRGVAGEDTGNHNGRAPPRSAGDRADGGGDDAADGISHDGERPSTRRSSAVRTPMSDCLFCKIIRHEIPASIEYEDERVLAFNDINPQAPTHVLIVPKRHIATLSELSADGRSARRRDRAARRGDCQGARDCRRADSEPFSIPTATPGRRSSTSICICSAGAAWRGRRGDVG